MLLKGSCHCGAVKFQLESKHPYPFNICYCSICRKTAGGGGYAINLAGEYETFTVEGKEHIATYNAMIEGKKSQAQRNFCKHCASALWLYDPRWPALVHPFASAIDSPLPIPPEKTHLMLASKQEWVETHATAKDQCFQQYPKESIAQWHQRLNLEKQ
ncbi:GFA family protein [Motilimonas pumila]|uniref:GFA family protein n=1 Tax=Motilimonas pumila TaxID=2303987 RepID=A0A418YF35_9GAMM|nr:GFA family protein [Motilimonas pumila]RJG47773.1 GFA family protein [Motilimonas pumila]